MRKLRRNRFLAFLATTAAIALVAAAPAAGEGSAGSTSGETAAGSPGGSTEPAPETSPPAPASPGWVPPGSGTEAAGDGAASNDEAAPTRGSSLGSGGGLEQAGSTDDAPSRPAGSTSSYYEPEASTPVTFEQPADPQTSGEAVSTKPPDADATTGKSGHAAVDAATPLTRSKSSQGDSIGDVLPAISAPIASPRDQGDSGLGLLRLLVMIAGGLLLVYSGVRLVLGPVEPDIPGMVRFGARRFR